MKYLASAILSIFLSHTMFSQSIGADSLQGKKALIFTFSGFNLGGGFGGKYWFNSSTTIRIQISLWYNSTEDNSLSNSDSLTSNKKSTSYHISPNIGIEKHFQITENISSYCGGSVGYSRDFSRQHFQYITKSETYDDVRNFYSAGAFVGIEYWISTRISLSGEQIMSLNYSKHYSASTLSINNSTSYLLLSVYF